MLREKLATVFDLVSMQKGHKVVSDGDLVGDGNIFYYEAHFNPGADASTTVLTQQDFSVQEGLPHHLNIEIFYEPQFYDLELLVVSKDASETKKGNGNRRSSNPDITMYKGAKVICTDLEPGDYTFQIISRLPGTDKHTEDFVPRYYEFQMYAVAGEAAPHKPVRPQTLNYLGQLGLEGKGFGSFVHILKDVEIIGADEVQLTFRLNGAPADSGRPGPSIDVQVIEIDGDGDQLDLSLVKVPKKKPEGEDSEYLYVQDDDDSKPHSERYMDSYEDGVDYEALFADGIHEKNSIQNCSEEQRHLPNCDCHLKIDNNRNFREWKDWLVWRTSK